MKRTLIPEPAKPYWGANVLTHTDWREFWSSVRYHVVRALLVLCIFGLGAAVLLSIDTISKVWSLQ